MGSEAPIFSVDELVKAGILAKPLDGNHGGVHPKSSDYVDTGVPFVMASDLIDGTVDTKNCKFITVEQANSLKKGFAKTGDVLLSHKATIGRTAIVGELDTDFIMLTPQITYYRIKDPNQLNNQYLRYYFDSIEFQNLFNQWAGGGSTRAYLGITGQLKLPIAVPKIEEQLVIANVLSTLDDKIQLNRQINTTLESMARALFKSWFVDFDPVIDNALIAGNPVPEELQARAEARDALGDQRKPLPESIRQQFPSRFVLTEEMGWVPEGWGISSVGEQVRTVGGGTPKTNEPSFWDGGSHAFCTPKDMSKLDSLVLMSTDRRLTDAGVARVSSGLLPKGTVLMSSRAPIGYLAISDIAVAVNQGVIAMLPSAEYGPLYLLLWAQENMCNITDRANGSTFLEISKKNFRPIPFLVPAKHVLKYFNELAEAIYEKNLITSEQSESLISTRDTLLPKLLSGELRIPDARAAVEKALD